MSDPKSFMTNVFSIKSSNKSTGENLENLLTQSLYLGLPKLLQTDTPMCDSES